MPGSFLKLNSRHSGFGELFRFEKELTLSLRDSYICMAIVNDSILSCFFVFFLNEIYLQRFPHQFFKSNFPKVTLTRLNSFSYFLLILIIFWSFFVHSGGFGKIKKLVQDGGSKITVLSEHDVLILMSHNGISSETVLDVIDVPYFLD